MYRDIIAVGNLPNMTITIFASQGFDPNPWLVKMDHNKVCYIFTKSYKTGWVAVVTPTDRPRSVRNRCVIEYFGSGFLCCHFWFLNCPFV